MRSKRGASSRWTPQAKRALSEIQRDYSNYLGVSPRTWGTPPRARDVNDLILWLEDYGDQTPTRAMRTAAGMYLGRRSPVSEPPTRYENRNWHQLTASLCTRLERAARTLKMKVPREPLFGTLPVGSLNAWAVEANGMPVTLVQVGLFNLLNSVSKLVCLACPLEHELDFITRGSGRFVPSLRWARPARRPVLRRSREPPARFRFDPDSIVAQLRSNHGTLSALFVDVLRAYLVEGDVLAGRRFLLSQTRLLLNDIFLTSAELFVLGHEYGHIIHGHLDEPDTRPAMLGEREVKRIPFPWEDEYQADATGLSLMIQAMQQAKTNIGASLPGAGLFFATEYMIERLSYGLEHGAFDDVPPRVTDTHPPTLARAAALQDALSRRFGKKQGKALSMPFNMPLVVLLALFDATRDEWRQMHKKGLRPARNLGFGEAF